MGTWALTSGVPKWVVHGPVRPPDLEQVLSSAKWIAQLSLSCTLRRRLCALQCGARLRVDAVLLSSTSSRLAIPAQAQELLRVLLDGRRVTWVFFLSCTKQAFP